MRILIGDSSSKIFHLQEFKKTLENVSVNCKLVNDIDYSDAALAEMLPPGFSLIKNLES